MNITDLVRGPHPEARRVGIRFPERRYVVAAAKRAYLELGIACDLDDLGISIEVPRIAAPFYMGALERLTGMIGYSDWEATP